jgi:hypothetical protein
MVHHPARLCRSDPQLRIGDKQERFLDQVDKAEAKYRVTRALEV